MTTTQFHIKSIQVFILLLVSLSFVGVITNVGAGRIQEYSKEYKSVVVGKKASDCLSSDAVIEDMRASAMRENESGTAKARFEKYFNRMVIGISVFSFGVLYLTSCLVVRVSTRGMKYSD